MTNEPEHSTQTIQAYLSGMLDEEAAKRLTKAAESDAALAAEIALWRAARDIHASDVEAAHPGEFGWARIERALGEQERVASANDNPSAKPFWSRQVIAPWQAAAAVFASVMTWQVAIVPTVTTAQLSQEEAYVLAGAEDGELFALNLAFVETASEAEIRALLRDAGARIVDGPSAIGLYTIAFEDQQSLDKARTLLASRSEIVAEIAER